MTAPIDYDLRRATRAIVRYWWVVLLVPAVALAIQLYQIGTAPYRAEFRAVVILPGDTETPGSSERPELMIMDDLPTLVGSSAFAGRVASALTAGGVATSTEQVEGALSATRYARTVTVVARDEREESAVLMASGAEAVLGEMVDTVLVADGAEPASVTIIDPVRGAARGEPNQARVAAMVTVVMVFVGVLAALLIDGTAPREDAG